MTCSKVRYRDRIAALIALDRIDDVKRPIGSTREVRAYRCPHCKGWHLTAQAKRGRRAG